MLSQMLANNPQAQQVLNNPQMLQQHLQTMQRMGGNNNGGNNMNGTPSIASNLNTSNPWGAIPSASSSTTSPTSPSSPPSTAATGIERVVTDLTTFATQLEQLQNMGFGDRDQNLRALRATNGVVSSAVDRILGGI